MIDRQKILASLDNSDPKIRLSAIRKLADQKSDLLAPILINYLLDKEQVVREEARAAILELSDPVAVPFLIKELSNSNEWRRIWAAQRLAILSDPAGILPLIDLLKDTGSEVRRWAAWALVVLGWDAVRVALYQINKESRFERVDMYLAFAGIDHQYAVDVLNDGLKDPDSWLRSTIADAFSNVPVNYALPALLGILSDENSKVIQAACRSLGKIFAKENFQLISSSTNDSTRECIQNIRFVLKKQLDAPNVDSQAAAAWALEQLG